MEKIIRFLGFILVLQRYLIIIHNFFIDLIFFDLEDVLHPEFFEEIFHYDGGSANTNS